MFLEKHSNLTYSFCYLLHPFVHSLIHPFIFLFNKYVLRTHYKEQYSTQEAKGRASTLSVEEHITGDSNSIMSTEALYVQLEGDVFSKILQFGQL